MRVVKLHIVLILLLIFILNQIIEWMGIIVPILHSYLDDLLAIPIILGIYVLMKDINGFYQLPKSFILVSVIMISLHFEVIMPLLSNSYTPDAIDILMYCLGAFLFNRFLNGRSVSKQYY